MELRPAERDGYIHGRDTPARDKSLNDMKKSLDEKLARIHADSAGKDFILADAKDADMALGLAAPGRSPERHAEEARFRTLGEYRDQIRKNVQQGLIDIMLMSASTNEVLTIKQRLFDDSTVTPAARANDTTDIHLVSGGVYAREPSRPFRTATIDHIMCGKVDCTEPQRQSGADLGLYSMTFNNDGERDRETLSCYGDFRIEAEQKGFRHFLEIFDPNACGENCPPPDQLGRFINDHIVRALAGVVGKGRPIFLKIAYHGPAAMEELASYDRHLIPGILGGSAGTSFDAFYQLWEAKKYGARAALYGRMINNSEHQGCFIEHLRWLADGQIDDPAEAVRSYHAALAKKGVRPYRSLEDDLVPTRRWTSYGGPSANMSKRMVVGQASRPALAKPAGQGKPMAGPRQPKMPEIVAANLERWDRVLG